MKLFARLIAVVLVAALALTFVACGENKLDPKNIGKDTAAQTEVKDETAAQTEAQTEAKTEAPAADADALIGKWAFSVNFADQLNGGIAGENEDMLKYFATDEFNVNFAFEFRNDGTCKIGMDEEGFRSGLEGYLAGVREGMRKLFEDMIAADTMDVDLDGLAQASGYENGEALLDETMNTVREQVSATDFSEATSEGFWKIDGNKLYVEEAKEDLENSTDFGLFAIDGDTLTIDAEEGTDPADLSDFGMELPLVLHRVG